MKMLLTEIYKRAEQRPDVNLQEFLNKGTIVGNYLEMPYETYLEFAVKYNPVPVPKKVVTPKPMPVLISPKEKSGQIDHSFSNLRGLGSVVEFVAKPVGKFLDKTIGTHFEGCGGCQRRKEKLNQLFPFKP